MDAFTDGCREFDSWNCISMNKKRHYRPELSRSHTCAEDWNLVGVENQTSPPLAVLCTIDQA